MAAPSQKIWGYETTWGSFAQFTKVQAQQLLPKPQNLTWEEAASYGLVYFTAYRMLMTRCNLQAGQKVLIWGAAGGLGVFATQLCKAAGAECVGVVSSDEKGELVKQLGAVDYINRNEFAGMMRKGGETPEEEKARFKVSRAFAKRVEEILGDAPDIVFEHVGKATFPTSVFTVKPFGKVVICAGTTGFNLDFDVRYLWMKQKEIIGSHFANAYECSKANELIERALIRPVLWRTLGFDGVAEAHQLMQRQQAPGQDLDPRRRREGGPGQDRRGPGRDLRGGGCLMAAGSRPHPLVRHGASAATSSRRRCTRSRRSRLRYGATHYAVYRSRDDRYKFLQIADFKSKLEWERYWYGPEFDDVPGGRLVLVPRCPSCTSGTTWWPSAGSRAPRRSSKPSPSSARCTPPSTGRCASCMRSPGSSGATGRRWANASAATTAPRCRRAPPRRAICSTSSRP